MATKAQLLLGATFAHNGVTVGEVTAVSGVFMTRGKKTVWSADSATGIGEILQALAEPGDLNISCIYDPSDGGAYNSLTAAVAAGTSGTATFTVLDGTTVVATAFISNLGLPSSGDPGSEMTVDLTVTPTTATGWTFTDAA